MNSFIDGLRAVNPFSTPYEEWETRIPTQEESINFYQKHNFFGLIDVKIRRLISIDNHYDAAIHQVRRGATNIELHIDDQLERNDDFNALRRLMPSVIPRGLSEYQLRHQSGHDYPDVDSIINKVGIYLPYGQFVYHGGLLSQMGASFITTRPLSTSFCPQIGVRLAEKNFSARNAGRMELTLLKVTNPKTKAYIFKNKKTTQGHEKEVVFASGAEIYLRGSHLVTMKYPVSTPCGGSEFIPGYVIVGEIS